MNEYGWLASEVQERDSFGAVDRIPVGGIKSVRRSGREHSYGARTWPRYLGVVILLNRKRSSATSNSLGRAATPA